MTAFALFTTAFVAALLLTPLARRIAFRFGVVAQPGGRRRHAGAVPRLGGLALFGAWLIGIVLVYLVLPPVDPDDATRLQGVVLGTLVIVLGGLIDDWRELPPWAEFGIQFLATAVAMSHIIFIELFTNPLPDAAFWHVPPFSWVFTLEGDLVFIWRPLALLFTLFWVVGMINAINWLDGLDGLATGVCTIAALLFAWHSHSLGQTTVPLFPLVLAGALLGFLPFNFAPARIFLGTAGAFMLGYQMATLSILSPAKLSTALLVLAVPILDVAWQIINRLRHGRSPLHGDRGHLHFRLADAGLPTRVIVVGYYIVTLAFGLIAVVVESRSMKITLWLLLYAAIFGALVWLSRRVVVRES